jgi:hypothetical protein
MGHQVGRPYLYFKGKSCILYLKGKSATLLIILHALAHIVSVRAAIIKIYRRVAGAVDGAGVGQLCADPDVEAFPAGPGAHAEGL